MPPVTITIKVNVDTNEPVKAESELEEMQEKLRASPDGAANINLGTTQLTVVRRCQRNGMGTAENFLKPQFMAADADANGYLEKSEAERAFLFGATFDDLDTDKNGKVFLDEALLYFQVRFDAARSRVVLTVNEQGRTLFEILDTDRDRRLSFRELQAAANKLSLWDKDGDGKLSQSEIPQQYRLIVARGNLPALGGNFFVAGDMGDGGTPSERTSGPRWFLKMDKNRDGEISRREFLGEITTFETLDTNHDGFIDLSEAVQAAEWIVTGPGHVARRREWRRAFKFQNCPAHTARLRCTAGSFGNQISSDVEAEAIIEIRMPDAPILFVLPCHWRNIFRSSGSPATSSTCVSDAIGVGVELVEDRFLRGADFVSG